MEKAGANIPDPAMQAGHPHARLLVSTTAATATRPGAGSTFESFEMGSQWFRSEDFPSL